MYNKVILVGRLTRDPELRFSKEGKAVCKFGLATDSGFGDKKETDFHNIVCFNKTAENVGQYCKQGDPIVIEGRIHTSQYEHEGQKRYKTEIIANQVTFLPKGKSNDTESSGESKQEVDISSIENIPESQIPF